MARRVRGGGKRPSSSLDSTARSPCIFSVGDEGEEVAGPSSASKTRVKVVEGQGSKRPYSSLRINPCASALRRSPDVPPRAPPLRPRYAGKAPMPISPNQGSPHMASSSRPKNPGKAPMTISPNHMVPSSRPKSTSTTFSNVCNVCGKVFKNHKAMWGHKGSHMRIKTVLPKRKRKSPPPPLPAPNPQPPAQAVRLNEPDQPEPPRVSLELGLALANGATRGINPLGPSGVPPMRGLTREWIRFREWFDGPEFVPRVQRDPQSYGQPLSDEELELKLGV